MRFVIIVFLLFSVLAKCSTGKINPETKLTDKIEEIKSSCSFDPKFFNREHLLQFLSEFQRFARNHVKNNSPKSPRTKRDAATNSYKFLMSILPQSIRDPLHHSIQGAKFVQEPLNFQGLRRKNENQKTHQPSDWFKKLFRKNVDNPPKLVVRNNQKTHQKSHEAVLLKKLKRLNNNPFSSNLEDQATQFMKQILKPVKKPSRQKRTIIIGSDEIDLPNHYHVVEECEDEPVEYFEEPYEVESSELCEECQAPTVGQSFLNKLLPQRPSLTNNLINKNIVQKAVRDELNNYQQKMKQQRKIQDMKDNLTNNPMVLLLTAPMQLLKHFKDLNRGFTPVMGVLPKMVSSAKTSFKGLAQNFQKHCLNLASNIIGDFDEVHPNVIETIVQPEGSRYRRDVKKRSKRYILKVLNDNQIHSHIEDFVTEKFSFLQRIQELYNKMTDFFTQHQTPKLQQRFLDVNDESQKKIVVKKLKPKLIIDNKGLPFMEIDGFKRPLLLKGKKNLPKDESSEEIHEKIQSVIGRAKENVELVGAAQNDFLPKQVVKERVRTLLEEIDQLVCLIPEDYDEVFEHLIRVEQLKQSVEQDWKRMVMDNKLEDIELKIQLLGKFSDLQKARDEAVKGAAKKLEGIQTEFARKQLIHTLIKLQKLQCFIVSVVEHIDQHLRMKTPFNTKKEIKFVDYLSGMKFVHSMTRNDLVKKFLEDRNMESQKDIEHLNKLKKLLVNSDVDPDKFDVASKLVWEMQNINKLLSETEENLNGKLERTGKVKKELKILFDLQKRFEECQEELNELLGNVVAKAGVKKDVKDIIAEIKRRHQDMLKNLKKN